VAALATAIEQAGVPAVVITALPSIASMAGATRVLRGVAITNPVGDSTLSREDEVGLRRAIVDRALTMLETEFAQRAVWQLPDRNQPVDH
jgi:glycine reductase complex component B subunit gamma